MLPALPLQNGGAGLVLLLWLVITAAFLALTYFVYEDAQWNSQYPAFLWPSSSSSPRFSGSSCTSCSAGTAAAAAAPEQQDMNGRRGRDAPRPTIAPLPSLSRPYTHGTGCASF